ncbi:MAG: glycosyltransferase family 2 protein [Oscillospiraceae bacterium]|jgi:glycosyltransferase involved in cell wall biosynthesis|nr:glycosyltransferase family 2 protein [Oscillospiraceae bacterium]
MKNQPLISIIVPIYNAEPYLRRCIDSILAQTRRNIEVMLIDDGSPDNCGAICDEYAERDRRVRVFHNPNRGVSNARNTGLDASSGEFIGFVDSDDFIEPEMYEKLYEAIRSNSADVACCSIKVIADNFYRFSRVAKCGKITPKELCEKYLSGEYESYLRSVGMWNALLSRKMLQREDGTIAVRFDESLPGKGEDSAFVYDYLAAAKNGIVLIDDVLYNYFRRSENASSLSKARNFSAFDDPHVRNVHSRLTAVMTQYLPERKADISNFINSLEANGKVQFLHTAIIFKFPVKERLYFRELRTILQSTHFSYAKYQALLQYFFPKWFYRWTFKMYNKFKAK